MACLAHDDWPSDDDEFERELKYRVHHLKPSIRAAGVSKQLSGNMNRLCCPCNDCRDAESKGEPAPRCSFFRCPSCETWSAKAAKHSTIESMTFMCRKCHRELLHARCGTHRTARASSAAAETLNSMAECPGTNLDEEEFTMR